jgi:hypothetical protein
MPQLDDGHSLASKRSATPEAVDDPSTKFDRLVADVGTENGDGTADVQHTANPSSSFRIRS